MATLIIPTPLRKYTSDQARFQTPGNNVREVIHSLIDNYQDLKPHLLDEHGQIRSFVRIYVGDEDINTLEQENTAVSENTVISIIPAIAGGCR